MIENVGVNLNSGLPKAAFKKKKLFYQKIGLKFEEETSKMLHLEHGVLWSLESASKESL
jgi:hypothetical protein